MCYIANFGPWALGPQHGFARTSRWSVKSPVESTDNSCTLTLSLSDNDSTRSIWNYKFELEYQLTLSGNSLKTNLVIHNKDEKEFDFTSLLHTYLRLVNTEIIDLLFFVFFNQLSAF